MKLELNHRVAEKLGVDQWDYESPDQFSSIMRRSLRNLDVSERGDRVIAAMEKELGLDNLEVSIMEVVSSARNPEMEGLEKQEKNDEDKECEALEKSRLGIDDIGNYGGSPTLYLL